MNDIEKLIGQTVKGIDTTKKSDLKAKELETLKIHQFDWKPPFFDDLTDEEFEMGTKIVSLGLVRDVYLVGDEVIIEHAIDCRKPLLNLVATEPTFKANNFPLNLSKNATIQCSPKIKTALNCTHPRCLVLVAGYVYHKTMKASYYDEVLEDVETLSFDEDFSGETDFDVVSRDDMNEIFTSEQFRKYRLLINSINEEDFLPKDIKINYLQLIKRLINYNERKDVARFVRPNLNYAFIENTDTVNRICLGQEKCITVLSKILKEFGIIQNENRRYVNFKELTDADALIDANYQEDIIVLYNIHYLGIKSGLDSLGTTIIKNNFPSFILNHSHQKIFIICGRNSNIKETYALFPQLAFRFETLHIPDLKIEEIYQIFMNRVRKDKYKLTLSPKFESEFKEYLKKNYSYSPYRNLEFIDFIFHDILKNSLLTDNPSLLDVKNFTTFKNSQTDEFQTLESLVGLASVKSEIQKLKTYIEFKKEKEAKGDKMPQVDLHMCYFGNPGTGKTTVARLMAGILFNLGTIRYNKCLEVESKDLIASIPGQTAIQTSEVIQNAMGGILFIDEAYSIAESPYGAECIATLIKAMEDYRDDLVVILAGYRVEMMKFLELNSGFKSRIAYTFDFQDYSNEELLTMTENLLSSYGFVVESYQVLDRLSQIYTNAKRAEAKTFGNSRFVRNTVEQILRQHAINTTKEQSKYKRETVITIDDVKL